MQKDQKGAKLVQFLITLNFYTKYELNKYIKFNSMCTLLYEQFKNCLTDRTLCAAFKAGTSKNINRHSRHKKTLCFSRPLLMP